MRTGLVVTLGLSIFVSWLGAGRAAAAAEPAANQLSKEEKKAGWKLLFDGKTTKGWRGYKTPEVPEAWKAIDGVLTLTGKGGDIMTADKYQDFELAIDWKIAPGGNSGIMYRVEEGEPQPYLTGPECQVLDDAKHPDATKGKEGTHKAGSLYDLYPPSKNVVRPAGEWNQAKIVLEGNRVEHWLNGEKVVEAEIGSEDWNKRMAESKWAKAPKFAKPTTGYIDLQDHGDKVEFRNIKIRVLGAKGAKAAKSAAKPLAK